MKELPELTFEKIFSVDDAKKGLLNNIKRYGKSIPIPSYKPRKIDRTFESLDSYYYRFKTEQEFIDKSGDDWRVKNYWTTDNKMDYLFGTVLKKDFPDNKEVTFIPDRRDGRYEYWFVCKDMLVKVQNKPSYKPRKIDRTLESHTKLNEGFLNPNYNFASVVIKVKSMYELDETIKIVYEFNPKQAITHSGLLREITNLIQHGQIAYLRIKYYSGAELNYHYTYGNINDLERLSRQDSSLTYEKAFTLSDLRNKLLDNIKMYGKSVIPNYNPREILR